MSNANSQPAPEFARLVAKLRELFQLDQPDLDFGIYRILNARAQEVTEFLGRDLLPQVREALAGYQSTGREAVQREHDEAVAQARALGVDPAASPKVKELKSRLEALPDTARLEREVYSHLLAFFSRYYDEGDFISLRRYKAGVYAIPYEGEEVKLHWANADQYYIKTAEHYRDYTFNAVPGAANPLPVHFKLVDAAEGEHGNIKESDKSKRLFVLANENPVGIEDGQLVIRFEHRPVAGKTKQADMVDEAVERILALKDKPLVPWLDRLRQPKSGDNSEPFLKVHLKRYTARNTFDYFIHKDLGGFLRRELDFYIKNEVLALDDVDGPGFSAADLERKLAQIKAVRHVALKLISFLAQLENFQKRLWLKKKFVIETHYAVTLDRVPEGLYPEIAANAAQREEWVRLCAIDEIKPALGAPGYSVPLKVEFLKANDKLMVDTRLFDVSFKERLLDALPDLDEQCDGVLMHSENFQALSLMDKRYSDEVDCLYIDPPYNTGDSEIPYKNAYLHSSWLALMENRLTASAGYLKDDPVLFIAIDDYEMVNLSRLVDEVFPNMRREMIVVNHHPQGGKATTLAHTHEYMLTCVAKGSDKTLTGASKGDEDELRPFKRSGTANSNFRAKRKNSFYAILVDPETKKVAGIEPPPEGPDYPKENASGGHKRIYPIGGDNSERVWRKSYNSCLKLIKNGRLECTDNYTIYQRIAANEKTAALFSNWVDSRYNAGTHGANLLRDIIGKPNLFSYPKSLHTVMDALKSTECEDNAIILDYFGGSGTTGHAAIEINRQEETKINYILVEMGHHFDTVLLPRLKKAAYAKEWKDGKPVSRDTGISHMIKYCRLESYEDALGNLERRRPAGLGDLYDKPSPERRQLREEHLLRYQLDLEMRGPSLLDIVAFREPDQYRLKVKRPGSEESREAVVDLIETFNWLLGLRVSHIRATERFSAQLEKDGEGRARVKGSLRPDTKGRWWIRAVEGWVPEGGRPDGARQSVLVIWRNLTEDPTADNAVLDAWFAAQRYSTRDSELALVYVNGDSNLENLREEGGLWKVHPIEREFHRLMFAETD